MAAQAFLYGGMAALQLAGGYFAAQNVRAAAELNQDIDEMNAEFAELDAYDSEIQGLSDVARYQNVIDETIGQQRTILAAQDVDTSFGSASTIEEESKFIANLNKMEIEKRAQEQALGYKQQARDYRLGSYLRGQAADAKVSQIKFNAIAGAAQSGISGYQRSK